KVVGNRRPLAFSMFIDLIASFTSASLFGFFLWPIPMKEQPGEIDNAEHPKSADRLGERGLALCRSARRVRFLLDPDRYVHAVVLRCGAFAPVVCGVLRVLALFPAQCAAADSAECREDAGRSGRAGGSGRACGCESIRRSFGGSAALSVTSRHHGGSVPA